MLAKNKILGATFMFILSSVFFVPQAMAEAEKTMVCSCRYEIIMSKVPAQVIKAGLLPAQPYSLKFSNVFKKTLKSAGDTEGIEFKNGETANISKLVEGPVGAYIDNSFTNNILYEGDESKPGSSWGLLEGDTSIEVYGFTNYDNSGKGKKLMTPDELQSVTWTVDYASEEGCVPKSLIDKYSAVIIDSYKLKDYIAVQFSCDKSLVEEVVTPVEVITEEEKIQEAAKDAFDFLGTTDVSVIIGRAISAIMGIMGSIALAMFVYSGILWMTAAGNSEKEEKSKTILLWSTLGVVVVFASYALLNFVFEVVK